MSSSTRSGATAGRTTSGMLATLSTLAAAVPLAFALIRALGPHHDRRYVWVAAAALVGATVVTTVGMRRRAAALGLSIVSFVVSALLAAAAGFLVGARSIGGLGAVAAGFALCCAASTFFRLRATSYE